MGEISKISWTNGTFNIAWGCTEVGPGCDNCYAREWAARFGYGWGQGAPRRYFGEKHWNDPIRWNKKAEKAGKRMKVFCSSMADIFDNEIEDHARWWLWKTIEETPWIDWQLLTKRISNAHQMFPEKWRYGAGCPQNVWLGITVVNQEEANRDIHKLVNFQQFKVLWLSIEPQLENIALPMNELGHLIGIDERRGIDWVVTGGESIGPGKTARPYDIEWARSIIRQCQKAKIAPFVKQLGSNAVGRITSASKANVSLNQDGWITGKGDKPGEWPEDLRVQEFPNPNQQI